MEVSGKCTSGICSSGLVILSQRDRPDDALCRVLPHGAADVLRESLAKVRLAFGSGMPLEHRFDELLTVSQLHHAAI
jgi:hypothetical protein